MGAAGGALTEPLIGWSGLFLTAGAGGLMLGLLGWAPGRCRSPPGPLRRPHYAPSRAGTAPGCARHPRAAHLQLRAAQRRAPVRVYTWLGVYLHQRLGLGPGGIGLALLGYGIPGFLLGPVIGLLADYARARLIPAGVAPCVRCCWPHSYSAPQYKSRSSCSRSATT